MCVCVRDGSELFSSLSLDYVLYNNVVIYLI